MRERLWGCVVEPKKTKTNTEKTKENTEAEIVQEGESLWGNTYTLAEWNKIAKDYQEGDEEAKKVAGEKAYAALSPFVHATAYKYYASYMPKYGDDILQEGYTGLIEALGTYIPSASRPTTWYFKSIIHRMRDFVDEQIHHTSAFYQKNIREIEECVKKLQAAGKKGTMDEVQIVTGLSRTTLESCYTIAKRNIDSTSLDAPLNSDGTGVVGDLLPGSTKNPEDAFIEKEKEACFLQDMKEMLDDDELEVISMIYGFCTGDDGISAAQLERESGYNKQEIKEIRSRAEEKLRCGWSRKNKQDDERKMRAVHLDHAAGIVPDSSTLTDNLASYIPGGDDEFDIFQSIVDYDQKMLGESDQ